MSIFNSNVKGNPNQCEKPELRRSIMDLGVLAGIVVAACGYAVYLGFKDNSRKYLAIFCAALGSVVAYFYLRFFQDEKKRFKEDTTFYDANLKSGSCSGFTRGNDKKVAQMV
jgi:hypothetical protein